MEKILNPFSGTDYPGLYEYFDFDVSPEFELLRVQSGITFQSIGEIPFYDTDAKDKLHDFLLSNNLAEKYNELEIIYCHIHNVWWKRVKLAKVHGVGYKKIHDDQLKILKDALCKIDPENREIGLKSLELEIGKENVKITDFYLLQDLFHFLKVREWMKLIQDQNYFKNPGLQKEEKGTIVKQFVQVKLFGLFNYLRNETILKDSTKTDAYSFIVNFCELIGIDWKIDIQYSSYNSPDTYLKDTFKNITS